MWDAADGVMELGMAVAGLFGGVYGVRAVRFLRQAREQSRALREIVAGNELFKKTCPEQAGAFKAAQQGQSAPTRVVVSEIRADQRSPEGDTSAAAVKSI